MTATPPLPPGPFDGDTPQPADRSVELVFEVVPPTTEKRCRPGWVADIRESTRSIRRLWRNLRRQV